MAREFLDDGTIVERMNFSNVQFTETRIEVRYRNHVLGRIIRRNLEGNESRLLMYVWDVRFTKRYKKLGLHDLIGLTSLESAKRALYMHINDRVISLDVEDWPSKHATTIGEKA